MATPEERLAAAVATAVAAANVDILAKISMMLAEKDKERTHDDRGILDHKSIHNLDKFKGDKGGVEEFHEWRRIAMTHIACESDMTSKILKTAETSIEPMTHESIMGFADAGGGGAQGIVRDKLLNRFLVTHTSGTAGAIVSAANGCGGEAWRMLTQRYDPKTAESRRGLIKRIANFKQCKNYTDLENSVREFEKMVRRLEAHTGKPFDEDMKVANLTSICTDELKSWLDLNTDDKDDYEKIRGYIQRQIQKKSDQSGPSPMDIGGMEDAGSAEHDEHPHGHDDQGYGYTYYEQIGAVSGDTVCHRCGGKGHFATNCGTPKGDDKGQGKGWKGNDKGKGKGWQNNFKGKGKGWQDNEGKGKGWNGNDKGKGKGKPINGSCYNCGGFGHMSKDCHTQGKGSAIHSVEENYHEVELGGFHIMALEANQWNEVKPKKDKTKRIYKKMDMYDMFSSTNRYQVLQEEPLHGADECTATAPICHSICTSSSTAVGSTTAHGLADKKTAWSRKTIVKDIMPVDVVEKKKAKMKIIGNGMITIDSGAAESVLPLEMLHQVPMHEGDHVQRNTVYSSADGGQMWNHGHKFVHFRNKGSEEVNMAEFQVTTVKKPLASVSKITDKGNRVVFESTGGYIENIKSGKRIPIVKHKGTFAIDVEYMIEEQTDNRWQNSAQGFMGQW